MLVVDRPRLKVWELIDGPKTSEVTFKISDNILFVFVETEYASSGMTFSSDETDAEDFFNEVTENGLWQLINLVVNGEDLSEYVIEQAPTIQ